ncbi:MAG: endonuclease/exonuclease/phosphatase family protein [Cyanobacteria bacterium J06627_8]
MTHLSIRLGAGLLFGAALNTGIALAATAETVKLATWNIEHLRATTNAGPNPRTEADYERLADYVQQLDADIIAFQEVEGTEAAARIFEDTDYNIFISRRDHPMQTGFAVREGIDVTQNPDLEALDVTDQGDLRHGTDITVTVNGEEIRMLSIHLKAFCFDKPLDDSSNDCVRLNEQLSVLESWIDARATTETPFVVLGDFNRRLNVAGDEFWVEIDDADPANADLTNSTDGLISQCWDSQFPEYIDHIVTDRITSEWVVPDSFQQIVFTEPIGQQEQLSDHCPIAITLDVPEEEDGLIDSILSGPRQEILERIEEIERELDELRDLIRLF